MTSLSFHIIYFSVVCICSIIPTSSQPQKHAELFIFGDSFFDARNNNFINTTTDYQANFWPYGETFFDYPTGRVSDGHINGSKTISISILFSLQLYLKSLPDSKNKKTQNIEIQNFLLFPNIK